MSTIAYSASPIAPAGIAAKTPRRPVWRRVYEAVIASQQLRAERAIAAYLESHGGLLTDDMEREIMARLSANGARGLRN